MFLLFLLLKIVFLFSCILFGEIYHKYFGTYFLNDYDFVEIGMNGSGPHLYCEMSNNRYGFIKEYDGPFEIKDNYIIAQIGINKFIIISYRGFFGYFCLGSLL